MKGIVLRGDRAPLLRDELEPPGGRLEVDETPEQCVAREIAEETGWTVKVSTLLDVWVYQRLPNGDAGRGSRVVGHFTELHLSRSAHWGRS